MPQIQKINQPIDLTCADCVLSGNSALISNERGFHQVGAALAAMQQSAPWWWADYLVYAETYGLACVLDQKRRDLHRSTLYAYKAVARFYIAGDRHPALEFGHHLAAMYCLGENATVKEAKEWLQRCAEGEWTVGELREKIRLGNRASENDPGPMRGIMRITDFVKVSRWTETVKASELEPREADELRKSTGSLFTFLCELHRKPFTFT
jgi:hypothetical protein